MYFLRFISDNADLTERGQEVMWERERGLGSGKEPGLELGPPEAQPYMSKGGLRGLWL